MWLSSPVSMWLCLTAHVNAHWLLVIILCRKNTIHINPAQIEFGLLLLKLKKYREEK